MNKTTALAALLLLLNVAACQPQDEHEYVETAKGDRVRKDQAEAAGIVPADADEGQERGGGERDDER